MPQIGAQVLEQSTNGTSELSSVIGLNDTREPMHAENAAAERRGVHIAEHLEPARFRVVLGADDRSLARQITFPRNPLRFDELVLGTVIAGKFARQVFLPPTD